MLMTSERRATIRTLRGWAISVLQEAGAVRECEEHGWMKERGDPTPEIAPLTSPASTRRPTFDKAVPEIPGVLDSIGDSCPECQAVARRSPPRTLALRQRRRSHFCPEPACC